MRRAAYAVGGILLFVAGCATGPQPGDYGRIVLPAWLTEPEGAEQACVLVDLGLRLPSHLQPLAEKYGLPGWVVYGVVRGLGSDEFLVNGVFRRFSMTDESGEQSVVLDALHYDVPRDQVEAALSDVAVALSRAKTERERRQVLGHYVARRFGGFLLFSLAAGREGGAPGRNLLAESGATDGPLVAFRRDEPVALPPLGWRETETVYSVAHVGAFRYGDPMGSFRRVEEDAIHELARSLLVRFSHMRRAYSDGDGVNPARDVREEVVKESLRLRMRGVRVTRRLLDLTHGACVVVLTVPRTGIALH